MSAPAARHFLVQASALAFAPLPPHLETPTHQFTVVDLPISSNARAVMANTRHIAKHSSSTFFMADFSFESLGGGKPRVDNGYLHLHLHPYASRPAAG